MSQVRKFAQGGGNPESSSNQTSTKHKPYRITIDGVVQELDDQDLANWARTYSTSTNSQQRTGLNDVINSIKRGNNVTYESLSNTFTGVNWTNQDIIDELNTNRTNPNQRQAERQKRRWARRDYKRGDARQQWMTGMQEAMRYNFNPIQPQQTETTSEDNRTALYGDESSWFDYNTDDKGNVTFSTGPENAGYLQRLKNFETFLNLSEDEAAKQYSWDDENDRYIQDLRTAWASNQTSENPFTFSGLIERMRANQLNETDLDWLRWMGFDKDSREDNADSAQQTVVPRSWEGSGFNDDLLEQSGYYVRKGKDGNTYLITASTDSQGNITYNPVTQNMYLIGNPLVQGTQWENGAIVNGRFYTPDQIFNQNTEATAALTPLFEQMRAATTPEEVRQILANSEWNVYGVQNPLTAKTYTSGQSYLRGFDNLLNNGTYYVSDISGQYNLPDNSNIIAFYDPNYRNTDGTFQERYAINHNGESQIFDNIKALQSYLSSLNITPYEGFNTRQSLGIYNSITQNGKRYIEMPNVITVGSGNDARAHSIYRDEKGRYYTQGVNGDMIPLRGEAIMEAIKNGTVTEQQLKDGIIYSESTAKPKWWQYLLNGMQNTAIPQEDSTTYEPGTYDSYFKFYKEGGKIPILQVGGLMSKGKIFDGTNNTETRKVGEATKAFGASKELKTDADKWAKAAGFLDTGGAALSFIPGIGNVTGAATGIAGSIARFTSDVKRDGLDEGDAKRLITNLGLDVLTLIPGFGSIAKAAKVGKAAKASKVLLKTSKLIRNTAKPLSVAGTIGGAATAIGAIADEDGEFTSDDFAQLGQGLLGMTGGIKNIKQLNKEAKLVKELTGKLKTPDLKTSDELKELKWYKKPGAWVSNKVKSGKSNTSNSMSARWLAYNPAKQDRMLEELIKEENIDLKKLVTDKKGNVDEKHLEELRNILGRYLYTSGQTWKSGDLNTIGERINPWWHKGNQFDLSSTQNQVFRLPEHQVKVRGRQNPIPSQGVIITPPPAPKPNLIQIPQFASSYRNTQGQFLLPRGNGRFFKKTQRVWNGGPAHEVIPIQPIKYSKTPRKSEFRNIGLEQAHKQKVLQEAGKQQVPAIRGLQEDIAKMRTSEDFKELLIKINNRDSYKEIIKNNPEIKDQLRQMFVHLDPVRLGNWMTKYNLRFKKGGIIKAQGGLKPGDLVYNNTNTNPYFDYEKAGILFNGSNVDWTKTYDKSGIFNAYRNYYINHWNDQSFSPYKQKYLQQLSQNNNNIDVNNLSLDEFERITSDQNLGYAHNLYIDQALDDLVLATMTPKGSISGGTLNEIIVTPNQSSVDMSKYTNPTVEDEVIEENIPQYVTPGEGQRDGLNPSSYTPKVNTFDPQLLFGAAELARSIATNNYMFKKTKEANKLIQKEMPTEIYDRYQDHITPAYQNAAQQKRQFFVPTSTDALTNYAMRQTNEDQARQLELEGNLKASEQYSQWLQNDLAARRAYAQDRRETALFNRQEMLNKLLRDAQIDQGRIAANNQSIANFVMEGRNWFHQNRQRALQAISQYDNAVAQNNYELDMRNAGQSYFNEFMNMTPEQRAENGGDWMYFWQTRDPQGYNAAQIEAFAKLQNARLHNRGLDVQWPYRIPTILAKKGGTLKYQQRHTGQKPDEAIWINRNKETAKALEKLHDAVIKLFMKSIS